MKAFPFWAEWKIGRLYTSTGWMGQTFAFRRTFVFHLSGLPFINQIALGKTKGLGLAGRCAFRGIPAA
jgi:hypothetical protein